MPAIRLLNLSGAPYDMGFQHGLAHAEDIREIAAERLHLSGQHTWTGRTLSHEELLTLSENCIPAHRAYAPDLMRELEGLADATGLSLAELIITGGFTDYVDYVYRASGTERVPAVTGNDCTAFLVPNEASATRQGYLGQTWDMHATATPYVIMLHGQPQDAPAFLAFTITGCVGMIGMNEHGIAVGINNLTAEDGQAGVTWPFVVRKMLMQDNLDSALACITDAPLAGAHNYLLMDGQGRGYNVEATPSRYHIDVLEGESLVHANKCLAANTCDAERPLSEDMIQDSLLRRERASELLSQPNLTPEDLMQVTRDRANGSYSICSIAEAPYFSESCGAVIMRPATRELWGVWGLPDCNEYERFTL